MIHEIIEIDHFIRGLPISGSEFKNFIISNKIGVATVLSFKKAKQWPYFHTPFNNHDPEKIPIIWAFLNADSEGRLNFFLGIHPMKCFPTFYLKNNENFKTNPIPIKKIEGVTWAGCLRYDVQVAGKTYGVKQNEYCYSFGLPDDCYSENFFNDFIKFIKNFNDNEIWFFEKDDTFQASFPKNLKIFYMKEEFLPKKFFFYIDSSSKFLSGIYAIKDLATINRNWWYPSGKEFIRERDFHQSASESRFEEYSIDIIKRKTTSELIRLVLLLYNKEQFKNYTIPSMPNYDEAEKISSETDIYNIVDEIKSEFQVKIDLLMKSIIGGLNQQKLRTSKFLVMDMEFVRVNVPIKKYQRKRHLTKKRKLSDVRSNDFPSLFVSIIWNGKEKRAEIDIKILILPCHFCVEKCKDIRNHSIKHRCLHFAESFINQQTSFFKDYLAENESAKIFSYGRSDVKQLEYSDNFFNDSFNARLYHRKNRKRPMRIIDIAQDIAIPGVSLSEVEEKIIQPWLIGWSREKKHSNVNRNFTIPINVKNFSQRYHNAIETCVLDSISAFLYILHKDYCNDKTPLKIKYDSQTTLF
jgi:hypothetical protein